VAERWLWIRSGIYDGINPDKSFNADKDSKNTYLESEADIAERANPPVDVGVQNSELSTTLSNITSQSQD